VYNPDVSPRISIDPRLTRDDVRCLPILHGRLESALAVRRCFDVFCPEAVAVELPPTLGRVFARAVDRLPLLSVVYYEQEGGELVYLPVEVTDGVTEAVRLATEHDLPCLFIDRDTENYGRHDDFWPDPYAATRIGYLEYCSQAGADHGRAADPEDEMREAAMAYHLQRLRTKYDRVLFVCGLVHYPRVMDRLEKPAARPLERLKRPGVMLAHLAEESSREILSEPGFYAGQYEKFRSQGPAADPDRLQLQEELWALAARRHHKRNQEELTASAWSVLRRFTRNYALITGRLTPNLYQLVIGARGAAGDDFAYEVWDEASHYPWQTDEPGLPVLRLRGEDLWLDKRRIRFHRRLKSLRTRLMPVPVKPRPRENFPGQWDVDWDRVNVCSWPPEDVVIEDFGEFLKKRATGMLSAESKRTVPFSTSMLDGLDMRETIRRWAEGTWYVFEQRRISGRVGSVVVIFDEDPDDDRFPWKLTWLGEHDQESDMAFYATPMGQTMVGPGISRCHHGGFMLTYPPLRVYDVWSDRFFDQARSKPERLLLAGIDYSPEKYIVYVAAKPPRPLMKSLAERLGKQVLFLPQGGFSPQMLRRLQTFHVLAGHSVRRYARDYIR
jgi:hypothetical protein